MKGSGDVQSGIYQPEVVRVGNNEKGKIESTGNEDVKSGIDQAEVVRVGNNEKGKIASTGNEDVRNGILRRNNGQEC